MKAPLPLRTFLLIVLLFTVTAGFLVSLVSSIGSVLAVLLVGWLGAQEVGDRAADQLLVWPVYVRQHDDALIYNRRVWRNAVWYPVIVYTVMVVTWILLAVRLSSLTA